MVDVVWWSELETWSTWSGRGLVVDARWSYSGHGRRGPWSTWSELGVARSAARSAAQRGLLDGSLRLANGSDSLFDGLESHLGDDVAVGDLVVMR